MVKLLKASLFLATTISVAAIPIPKSAIEPNVATYEDTQGSGIEKRHHHWTPIELVMYDLGKVDDNMNTFTDRAEQYDGGFWAAVHIAHNLKHMAKYIKKADKSSEGLEPINTDDSNSLMDMMNKLDPDTQDALEALKGKKDLIEESGYKDKVVDALVALQDIYRDLSQNVIERIDESKSGDLQDVVGKMDYNIKDALTCFQEE